MVLEKLKMQHRYRKLCSATLTGLQISLDGWPWNHLEEASSSGLEVVTGTKYHLK